MARAASGGLDATGTLGARVRTVRVGHGTSLRELARRIGVSPGTMSAVETGQTPITLPRLTRIADALGVDLEEFISPVAGDRGGAGPVDLGATERTGPGSWRDYPRLDLGPILTAALECFVDVGFHAASIRQIAHRAGLSVPGVYHHYASKQQMLARLMELTMDDLLHRSRAAAAEQQGPVERFSALVECLVLFHTQRRDLAFVASSEMRSLEPDARQRLRDARNFQQRMFDAEVLAGRELGVFQIVHAVEASRAVGTLCTAVAGWFRPDGPRSAAEVARQHVAFALDLVQYTGGC